MREKILLSGEENTSKTLSLVSLAIMYPDSKVVIFDPDDGTSKVMDELGIGEGDLPNLTVKPVTANFEKLIEDYHKAKDTLGEGDWLCLDMLGRFWDFAQNFYSYSVFGVSSIQHLMTLKKEAGKINFGGFDGLTDWVIIKRLHNQELMDDAVLWSPFNVMCTTSTTTFSPKEKVPTTGIMGIYAGAFGIKPEGEKHNVYRFDTQAVLYRDRQTGGYHFRIMRDRGRTVDINKEFDITGKNFMQVYSEYRGL